MKRCAYCKSLMPEDVTKCLRCGRDSSQVRPPETALSPEVPATTLKSPSKLSSIKWLRVFATVAASKVFFLASCTTGMLAVAMFPDSDDYGPAITETRPGPKLSSFIATVPDTAAGQGQRKTVLVFVSELNEFKEKNPDYSFLLPPGRGQIENTAAEMLTQYSVVAAGPGKVIVKSHFHHDVPPTNIDVRQRYEATDKSVKLLNAKFGSDFGGALVSGFALAMVLSIAARILRGRMGLIAAPLTGPALKAQRAAESKRTLKLLAAAIVFGVVVPILLVTLFGSP